ncbi:cell division protein FtsZ [Holophaga foetida]|uniref:cell division protein FtsZ n=1 Tax=Holophaga foetida TaxID=35839 RepID=UPI0002472121|nr:cell division protein FtsZ [Holophaga foetida]
MPEIAFLPSPINLPGANIKVVGVGGAGCNAIDRMIASGVSGVQFIAMNTDQQSLAQNQATARVALGPLSMRGLGAGGNSERGAVAAEESREEILAHLQGADMVFITGGMGGGTGTGAAPVVASCARELGALTVAVVLTPFSYEGAGKAQKAAAGLDNLRNTADTVIVVSNQKLLTHCEKGVKVKEAYQVADGVLIQGVRGITDLILRPGTLNGDFADVEAVLRNGREALIGTGNGKGEEALLDALQKAMDCPLLERGTRGPATQVIVSVMADWDRVELSAVETAMNYLSQHYQGLADIKLCQVEAPELEDRVLVTVLASGFDKPVESFFVPEVSHLMGNEDPVTTSRDLGRVYGETSAPPTNENPVATPTRLLPQAPTPSGEVVGLADDLHVPAIIRMNQGQGRLPME